MRSFPNVVVGLLMAGVSSHAQTLNPPPRDVIKLSRDLGAAEIAAVLDASRHAIDGRTFRISYDPDGPGPEIKMGGDGRPALLRAVSGVDSSESLPSSGGGATAAQSVHRDIETRVHYTRKAARGCDGTAREGELVLEYENDGSGWKVEARTRSAMEMGGATFDILSGAVALVAGPVQRAGERTVRPLTAPFKLPEGTQGGPPPGTTMSLWLDTESLLPVKWSLAVPAMPEQGIQAIPELAMVFTYLDAADLQAPTDIPAPDCVK